MRRLVSIAALIIVVPHLSSLGKTQGQPLPKPIDDAESYAVYRALLPNEWSVRVSHAKNLIFQQETATCPIGPVCCTPSGGPLDDEWREVLENFKAENSRPRVLLPGYDLGIPYRVVTLADRKADGQACAEARRKDPKACGFPYPESAGLMQVSAVGFDAPKRRAMVYMAHECGSLCGGGTYHFLEKTDGAWREVKIPASNCLWVS